MKKLLLLAMAVTVGMASFAQKTTYQVPTVNPALAKKTAKATKRAVFDKANQAAKPVKPSQNIIKPKAKPTPVSPMAPIETKIGETTYDLQTNSAVGNRIVLNPNGTVQATWTYSSELNSAWSDRGTGYNYFDGTSWGAFPTSRIEGSTRTGWPEIVTLADGSEVVISHAPGDGVLLLSKRNPLGSGAWTSTNLTSLSPSSILWPRAAAGGPDGNTIHLIAHNDQADPPVNGVSGMVFYSRSLDGGQTWDIQSIQIPGFDNTNYAFLSADGYAISANGNTVAIIYFGALERTVIAKSTDNGTTWTSQNIFDIPFTYDPNSSNTTGSIIGISDFNNDGVADTANDRLVNSTDGAGTIIVDNNGVAHVFFGFMDYFDDTPGDGSWSYYPGVNGIGYWNDNFGTIEPQFIAGALDLDQSGVLLDNYPTIDIALYYSSLTTMPSAALDNNGCLYVVYSSIMETMDQGAQFYRHIYGIKSCDNGCTWSFPIDLTDGDDFAECVFPSMAHNITNEFHFIYQKDPEPGLNLQGDQDAVGVNEIMHVKDDVANLSSTIGACVGGINAENTIFCSGDSVLVTATCGTSWAWSTGATTQSTYVTTFGTVSCDITTDCGTITDTVTLSSPSTAPEVTVTATPDVACPGDSIDISTNLVSGASWLWSTGDITQAIVVDTVGTFTVTVTNCGGSTTQSVTVNLPPAVTAAITGETSLCAGDSILLSANAGSGLSYEWSTGDSTETIYVNSVGTYSVTVTNCTGSDSTGITISTTPPANPMVTVLGNDTVCQGQSVGLVASGAGVGGTYHWSSGETTSTVNITASGDYFVTGINACGDSVISDTVTIVVNPLPPVAAITCFSSGSDWGFVCPQCTTGAGTFQWKLNGASLAGQTSDTLSLDWQSIGSGSVTVTITDNNGCSSTSPNGNCFVGIEDVMAASAISIYPNPNDGHFALTFNNMENDKYAVSVKNILGQVVYSKRIIVNGNYRMNMDLSEFEAGVYFLTVANSDGEQTRKVIVR